MIITFYQLAMGSCFPMIIETDNDIKNSKANYIPVNFYDVCRAWLTAKFATNIAS